MPFALLSLEPAKALLEAERCTQLQELVCARARRDLPRAARKLGKATTKCFGEELVFTSDITILNILLFVGFFIYFE